MYRVSVSVLRIPVSVRFLKTERWCCLMHHNPWIDVDCFGLTAHPFKKRNMYGCSSPFPFSSKGKRITALIWELRNKTTDFLLAMNLNSDNYSKKSWLPWMPMLKVFEELLTDSARCPSVYLKLFIETELNYSIIKHLEIALPYPEASFSDQMTGRLLRSAAPWIKLGVIIHLLFTVHFFVRTEWWV